jgi:hypothetical protein
VWAKRSSFATMIPAETPASTRAIASSSFGRRMLPPDTSSSSNTSPIS